VNRDPRPSRARTARSLGALLLALALSAPGAAHAVEFVPAQAPSGPRPTVDVWINKEEGGVYQPGENMRVFFRTSVSAYVLIYNIDTEGYIHLIYPYGPSDPARVGGGETYQVPARHDPYELVADGPPGMEFVVAVMSPLPFQNLPWYLSSGPDAAPPPGDERPQDDLQAGVIVGDPYVGMGRVNSLILPPGAEGGSATNQTFFYIARQVEYPRYVCADCHHPGFAFDPYLGVCPVVTIQVDATWARYAPVPAPVVRPRYYYTIRPNAPTPYRAWKERWSTLDGTPALRSKFEAPKGAYSRRSSEARPRSVTPPDQGNSLRRDRPGRLWMGRDQVLRLWEQRYGRFKERQAQQQKGRERQDQQNRERQSKQSSKPQPDQPAQRQQGGQEKQPPPPKDKSGGREKSSPQGKSGESKGNDHGKPAPPPKGKDRDTSPPSKGSERGGRNR
jgi:hypothetical protein